MLPFVCISFDIKPSHRRGLLKIINVLIPHVDVEPAHNSDANALTPAIEPAESAGLKPEVVVADSLYGSDENCQQVRQIEVDVMTLATGTVDVIVFCPYGPEVKFRQSFIPHSHGAVLQVQHPGIVGIIHAGC